MKKFLLAAVTTGMLAMGGTAASALVFDFSGANGLLGNSVDFSLGGVTVTVSTPQREVTQNGSGLGVLSAAAPDDQRMDSDPFPESLDFSFSKPVKISSITFGEFGPAGGDLYDLYSGGTAGTDRILKNSSTNAGFAPELETDFLRVRAKGGAFRVSEVSFTPSAVPLPAGLPLLAGALGLLGLARRRKS